MRSIEAGLVAVDQAALPLGGAGGAHFGDDVVERRGFGLDGAGERIAAERAEADASACAASRRGQAASGRRRP